MLRRTATLTKVVLAILCATLLQACEDAPDRDFATELTILMASENESLKPLLDEFAQANGVSIATTSKGSVEIMHALESDSLDFDAIWPSNSIWISLGEKSNRIRNAKPILVTPVVMAVRDELLHSFGWAGKEVRVEDIAKKVSQRKLRFAMTSASQSNSGASAYLAFLHGLKGTDDPLSAADLENDTLLDKMRILLAGVNRSSGSSGWLKDLFLQGDFDAMVNYESIVIETNKALVQQGRKPLHVIYPENGVAIADAPLGMVAGKGAPKEKLFAKLQDWLRSPQIQARMASFGRRPAIPGAEFRPEASTWDTAWGIQPNRLLSPFPLPQAAVIRVALEKYQTELRKPSRTVFCLDFSTSMKGDRIAQLRKAMRMVLDPTQARYHLIQAARRDTIAVVAFSDHVLWTETVAPHDSIQALQLANRIDGQEPYGGTAIYSAVIQAMGILTQHDTLSHVPSVVLLTDGESNTGSSFYDLQSLQSKLGRDIPVFSIRFGDASSAQLDAIAAMTKARVLDGTKDLAKAFRQVKGYN